MFPRFILMLGLLVLSACGGGERSPYGGSDRPVGVKLGKPYSIMGQYYEPRYEPDYVEEGMASWYGPGFHGRMTASGERFNTNDLTAAHRTLPMPSLVRVTLLSNGKSIIARVNDRGPFKKDRVIDMSSAAADALGLKAKGSGVVRVEYLEEATDKYLAQMNISRPEWMRPPADTPQTIERQYATIAASTGVDVNPAKGPAYIPEIDVKTGNTQSAAPTMSVSVTEDSPFSESRAVPIKEIHATTTNPVIEVPVDTKSKGGSRFFVQTAAFKDERNAELQAKKLTLAGPSSVKSTLVNGEHYFRVLLGPAADHDKAQQMLEHAKTMGFTDARIIIQ